MVAAHVDHLADSATEIIADGVRSGEFAVPDPRCRPAVPYCTPRRGSRTRPAHAAEWGAPGVEAALDRVCTVLLEGLRADRGDA